MYCTYIPYFLIFLLLFAIHIVDWRRALFDRWCQNRFSWLCFFRRVGDVWVRTKTFCQVCRFAYDKSSIPLVEIFQHEEKRNPTNYKTIFYCLGAFGVHCLLLLTKTLMEPFYLRWWMVWLPSLMGLAEKPIKRVFSWVGREGSKEGHL